LQDAFARDDARTTQDAGHADTRVIVPDLRGSTLPEAIKKLKKVALTVGQQTWQPRPGSLHVPPSYATRLLPRTGKIVAHKPGPGARVHEGTAIDLTLVETCLVHAASGSPKQILAAFQQAGFDPANVKILEAGVGGAFRVTKQIPQPNQRVDCRSKISVSGEWVVE
jgi:hypothetical protein